MRDSFSVAEFWAGGPGLSIIAGRIDLSWSAIPHFRRRINARGGSSSFWGISFSNIPLGVVLRK